MRRSSCARTTSKWTNGLGEDEDQRFCRVHLLCICQKADFHIRALNNEKLVERMRLFTDVKASKLWTDKETSHCFYASRRPVRTSDARGFYRYQHYVPSAEDYDYEKVMESVFPGAYERFQKDGTVNIKAFDWLFITDITADMLDELQMYNYHSPLPDGQSDQGWLRNAYYSCAQQLIRQDPLFYIACVCLRPDHRQQLDSYPYYCEHATATSKTNFRHLDNHPDCLLAGDGVDMLGSEHDIFPQTSTPSRTKTRITAADATPVHGDAKAAIAARKTFSFKDVPTKPLRDGKPSKGPRGTFKSSHLVTTFDDESDHDVDDVDVGQKGRLSTDHPSKNSSLDNLLTNSSSDNLLITLSSDNLS